MRQAQEDVSQAARQHCACGSPTSERAVGLCGAQRGVFLVSETLRGPCILDFRDGEDKLSTVLGEL